MLSDRDLAQALDSHALRIDPLDRRLIQPASIDVRLGNEFRVFDTHALQRIDPRERHDELTRLVVVPDGEPFVLHPREFVLASTAEVITVDDRHAARLEGKSSLGRLGLEIHKTAGFIDPGFSGTVTLELSNVNTVPFLLWPGMLIGQLCVFRLSSPSKHPYGSAVYGSRYQGQRGPTASRAWLRWADPGPTPIN